MAEHNDLGKKGEMMAEAHLLKNGYTIVEKNWRFGRAEIDIIAQKDHTLAIVEVKTRTTDWFGNPQDFVNHKKKGLLINAANEYIIVTLYASIILCGLLKIYLYALRSNCFGISE